MFYLTNTGGTKCLKAEKWNKPTLLKINRHHTGNVIIMFKNIKLIIRYILKNCGQPVVVEFFV